MRSIFVVILFFISSIIMCQDFGVRVGVTTATPTGNNDAYEFNFLESLSPGYRVSLFGNFEASNIITVKPEISHKEYAIKQKIDFGGTSIFDVEQRHTTFSADFNFDIRLTNKWSLIFGIGVDYLIAQKNTIEVGGLKDTYNYDLTGMTNDERLDPFANVGLCFKIGKSIIIDLEYRHLLDNWGAGDLITGNQLLSSDNGSVKLHMLNFSIGLII